MHGSFDKRNNSSEGSSEPTKDPQGIRVQGSSHTSFLTQLLVDVLPKKVELYKAD